MSVKVFVVIAVAAVIAATLEGCGGGGGGGPTPAPGPSTTTTTTTTWPTGRPLCEKTGTCSPPADGAKMAAYLNENYKAFDPKTMSGSALGVYVTMQSGGDLHHYCEAAAGGSKCYKGRADCILSVALYNRWIMLDGDEQGAHLKVFAGRSSGYVINTSLAENRYNKCAYIFDGASSFKYNQGCGDGAAGEQLCSNAQAAYFNKCPSTGKTCTIDDVEIQPRTNCEKITSGPYKRKWPNTTGEAPCYFTGPSFGYPAISAEYNKINQMVENRIYNQNPKVGDCSNPMDQCAGFPPEGENGRCCRAWKEGVKYPCKDRSTECNRLAKWNEVVMDLRPMIEDLKNDPNPVIPAFVYSAGNKVEAEKLRKTFKDTYGAAGDAPLILMDQTVNVADPPSKEHPLWGNPFRIEAEDETVTI